MSEFKRRRKIGKDTEQLKPERLATVDDDDDDGIDLIELFYRLLNGWKLILATFLIGAVIAGIISFFVITPKYTATSTIYVLSNKESVINMSDLQIGSALTYDYQKVFDMWEVHERVLSKLNLNYTYKEAREMLSVTNTSDTRMLDISVTSTSAQEAADMANAYAQVASDYIFEKMGTEQPSVMSRALVPSYASSPNKTTNIALGAMIGFVLGAGYIVIRFLMDDKIRTADDVLKYTGLNNLAVIPIEESQKKEKKKDNKK